MKSLTTGLMLAALTALAACAGNTSRPTDTGSMALPSTNTTGTTSTTSTARDVGSMTAPSGPGSGGAVSRTVPMGTPSEQGSMALPSAAQGNSVPVPRRY